jgi:hypothetical protein
MADVTKTKDDIPRPVPRSHTASGAVSRARDRLEAELRYLASIEHELSTAPGTKPERCPDFWLGLLRGTCAYLLWTLREQDKATGGHSAQG